MGNWNDLSIRERADLIRMYMDGGVMSVSQMREHYNSFDKGGYKPSQSIKDYIKKTEAFRSNWYLDGNGVPTVGYGFTGKYYKEKYPDGMTREQADKEFDRVLDKFAGMVKTHTPNYDSLSQNQKDALLSYMYNVGPGNYTKRSPKFQQALRDKDWNAAASHMDIGYNDKKNPGLRKRRDYERGLFLNGTSPSSPYSSASFPNYYEETKNNVAQFSLDPAAYSTPQVGMPSLYYAQSSPYKDVDFSSSLPEFNPEYTANLQTYPISQKHSKMVSEASVYKAPTNEEIIGDLWNRLDGYENIFDYGGDTSSPIGKPLYWNPEPVTEDVPIPMRAPIDLSVNSSRNNSVSNKQVKIKNEEQKAFVDSVFNNLGTSEINFKEVPLMAQSDATRVAGFTGDKVVTDTDVYKPLSSRLVESKILKDGNDSIIQQVINNLKSEDEVKGLQKELYEKGYLKPETPKLKAKTKEEIKEIQRRLKNAGYDIGNSGKDKDGIDGIIGSKTRSAWENYSREHADEAALNSVVDGKIGKRTMAAIRAYYKDMPAEKQLDEKNIISDQVAVDSDNPYALSVQMYRNIPTLQKVSSLVGTTIPSHVGAFANKSELSRIGKQEGIEDYDAFVADEVEAASEELSLARKSGNEAKIAAAKERVASAREKLRTNKLNRSRLSNAEKKAAMAILTGINGGKQMTYDDYMSNINLIGGEDGNYLGSNPRHKHKKSGRDIMLYEGRSGYHVMNEAENSRGGIEDKEASNSWIGNVIDAERRIYEDPNRGRLGAFSYYVDNNGDIHIYDRLEATEKKAARGANDKANYNAARDFFPRSSTSEMRDIITGEEYKNYIEKVLRKEKRKSKKE